MSKPVIYVLSLGGTIAMTKDPDSAGGVVPSLTGEALVASVPDLGRVAQIETEQIAQLGSSELQFDDLDAVAERIQQLHQDNACHGVVITQGTDTIEESAFILDCLLDVPFPVVVTGAMRNPTLPGSDGPANILSSVRVATDPAAHHCGVLVVLNDEIHAARFVHKAHTTLPNAFVSINGGRIGWLSENNVFILFRPEPMPTIKSVNTPKQVVVPLIKAGLGDSGVLLSLIEQHVGQFQGLVIEGTGGGHVSEQFAQRIEQLTKKIPVVMASRTGQGSTLTQTYGYPGSEIDLLNKGVIMAGWMDGTKARIILNLLLRHQKHEYSQIVRVFQAWGGHAKADG